MRMTYPTYRFLSWFISLCILVVIGASTMFSLSYCANPNPPGGGPKDSIPPVLMGTSHPNNEANFNGKQLVFYFTENITLKNQFQEILINPIDIKNKPKLSTAQNRIRVEWKENLKNNTTYSINFGKSIFDLNENNPYKRELHYVFSTGNTVDSNIIYGRVLNASSGKADSTMIVTLYSNLSDSALVNDNPVYITGLDTAGRYRFFNIKRGIYKIYAMKDKSRLGKYLSTSQLFSFKTEAINIIQPINRLATMYAFSVPEKKDENRNEDKQEDEVDSLYVTSKIKSTVNILDSLSFVISKYPIRLDTSKIHLIKDSVILSGLKHHTYPNKDSSLTNLIIDYDIASTKSDYILIIEKEFIKDEKNTFLQKTDTIHFNSIEKDKYGQLKIQHNLINGFEDYYVLVLSQNNKPITQIPLTQKEISISFIPSGEYSASILNDKNKNGTWDYGSFFIKKRQPEIVTALKEKVSILASEETTYIIDLNIK